MKGARKLDAITEDRIRQCLTSDIGREGLLQRYRQKSSVILIRISLYIFIINHAPYQSQLTGLFKLKKLK